MEGGVVNIPEKTTAETSGRNVQTDINLLKCPKCSYTFSDENMPRNLSCGHTICTACADSFIYDDKLCPECHEKQKISDFKRLPVNYQLLRISRSLRRKEIHFDTEKLSHPFLEISDSPFTEDLWNCTKHNSPKVFFCRSCNSWICENCLVLGHPSPPRGSCNVLQFTPATEKIRSRYNEVSAQLLKDIESIKNEFEFESGIHYFCLKHCTNERSHLRLVKELEPELLQKEKENNEKVEEVKESLKRLTDSFHATNLPDKIVASCRELIRFQKELNVIIKQENKKLDILQPSMLHHFNMEVKRLCQGREPVYATLQENGRFQWSRISVLEERLLLYALNEGKPPRNGIRIPYRYMEMLLAENRSRTVFFEVEADGEDLSGRVFVELCNENPLTNQMNLMCSGKKGVSYRNSNFFQRSKGHVGAGDYKRNDGTSGGPIVEGLGNCCTNTVYSSMNSRGIVHGERHSTKFHIQLFNENNVYENCLGKVTHGLKVIEKAVELGSVEKAYIKDCGIFVPMKISDRTIHSHVHTEDFSDWG